MLKRYGRHEWDTELYADAKYVIVQRSLVVATKKTEGWPVDELKYMYRSSRRTVDDWLVETIADFCPAVSIPDAIVLSLTKDLSDELQTFLGGDFSKVTTPDIMSPAQAREESRMKLAAADTMMRIYSKHWGDGWHLISHPEVERSNQTRASGARSEPSAARQPALGSPEGRAARATTIQTALTSLRSVHAVTITQQYWVLRSRSAAETSTAPTSTLFFADAGWCA